MNLQEFDEALRRNVGDRADVRPFVCYASPLSCEAFIVGERPATGGDFWPFWRPDLGGFQRSEWLAEYEASRRRTGERTRSNTRERLDRISAAASPVQCLETNVFADPLPATGARGAQQNVSVLGFLVRSIQPAVVLACGDPAREAMIDICLHVDRPPEIIESRHLRSVSYSDATNFGARIKEIALARRT
jgi:hypothetical protein